LVTLLEEHRQWFKAGTGLEISETPRDVAFCNHTILTPDILVVPDARSDARFSANALVTDDPHLRFYAGYPLTLDGTHRLGTFCVLDTETRQFTEADKSALAAFGSIVEALLRLHSTTLSLRETAAASERKSRDLHANLLLLGQA
jgi:GAF domain-containing protein